MNAICIGGPAREKLADEKCRYFFNHFSDMIAPMLKGVQPEGTEAALTREAPTEGVGGEWVLVPRQLPDDASQVLAYFDMDSVGNNPHDAAGECWGHLIDMAAKVPPELKFSNPVFHAGTNLTVRRGLKWYREQWATVDVWGVKGVVRLSCMSHRFSLLTDHWVRDEHDPACRTVAGLLAEMQRVYPGFSENEEVTLVRFDLPAATPPAPQRLAQGEDAGIRYTFGDVKTQFFDGFGWVIAVSDVPTYVRAHQQAREEAFPTQPPHHDRGEVEQRARELLAREYDRSGNDLMATRLRSGVIAWEHENTALAAITAALTEAKQQEGEPVHQYWLGGHHDSWTDCETAEQKEKMRTAGYRVRTLYTAPQVEAKRQTGGDHG